MQFGLENLPKQSRDNYVIVLQATSRALGIALVCLIFYFINQWVYFIIIELALLAICLGMFMKYAFESPLYVMTATGDHDMCKFIFNSIAIINDEEIIREKLTFPLTTQ